jgi:hypothetical protein
VRRRNDQNEDGSVLILALVFISLFGLFIAALLSQGEVNFKTTLVTRGENDKLFGADGGVEVGVQQLRTNDTLCPNVAGGTQSVTPVPALNSRTVTVTCRTLAGAAASPAAQQWSVITTGSGAGSITYTPGAGSTATPRIAGGDVFLNSDPSLGGAVSATEADVTRNTAACAQPANLTVGEPDLWACASGSVPDVPHVLPPVPDTRPDPGVYPCGGRTWRILHPGKYSASATPDLLLYNYLESGVYYFEDLPLNLSNRVLIGGQPATGETNVLSAGCPTDTSLGAASRASGKGVTIILGGTSAITLTALSGANDFELFSRQGVAGDTYTPGVSIFAVPDNSVSGYKAFSGTTSFVDNTGIGGVAIHGLVYSPTANVSVFARHATYAPLLGGVVTTRLVVQTPAGSSGSLAAVSASGRRTVLLTSTAAGVAAGESATSERAVVKIANDPNRTATVRSWRTTQ